MLAMENASMKCCQTEGNHDKNSVEALADQRIERQERGAKGLNRGKRATSFRHMPSRIRAPLPAL
jgi:hypothetical protein